MRISWRRLLPLWCVTLMLVFAPWASFQRDMWTDEAFTASYTAHPTIGMVLEDVRKNEETPPISFLLTWAWARAFGQSVVALRLFSLLAGLLASLVFARFAQRWLALPEAWIAGTLFAIAPLGLSFLSEARGYTLTLLFAVACIAAFEQLYRQPERRLGYVLYAPLAMALFLTSYFGVAILLAHNLVWLELLLRDRSKWRPRLLLWSAAQLFVGAVILLWLPALLYQMKVSAAVTSAWGDGLRDYYLLALSVLLNLPPRGPWLVLWITLSLLAWGLILIGIRSSRAQDDGLVMRAFGVSGLMLLLLIMWMQVVAPRYLMVLLPGAALSVAQGVRALRQHRPRLGLALGLALIAGIIVYRVPTLIATTSVKPWSALVSEVERQTDPRRDVVLFHPPWDQRIFEYYYHGPQLQLFGVHDYDTFYYEQGYDLRTAWKSDQALAATRGSKRVWLFYDQMFHTVPHLNLPYTQVGHWRSDRLELFLYEVPAPYDR